MLGLQFEPPAEGSGAIKVMGTDWCSHSTHQIKIFDEAGVSYDYAYPPATMKRYPTLECRRTGQSHVGEMSVEEAARWCPGALNKVKGKR